MLRKLALLALALIAIAQPLTALANFTQAPRICDDVIPPDLNLKRSGDQPPDDDGCPIGDGRSRGPYFPLLPPPPPCTPDAFTGICILEP
jgi:hypothetical protein